MKTPASEEVGMLFLHEGLLRLLTRETPAELKAPGSYMHKALEYRDDWQSRLLRTSSWSPLY